MKLASLRLVFGVLVILLLMVSVCSGRMVSESVVRIRVTNGRENSYGSGGYIGSGLVLTCAHIFRDGPERSGDVFFQDGTRYPYTVKQLDTRWDQAVLQLSVIPDKPALVVASKNPEVGEKVWSYGYGKGSTVMVTVGTVRRYTFPTKGYPPDWIVVTGRVDQGSSGGPLVNNRGEIIGPLWGTGSNGSGWETVGIITGRTRRFLLPWNAQLQGRAIASGLLPKGSQISPGGT